MAKYTSGRQKNLKVGISSYSENLTSLEVIGKVGIGTTNAQSNLYVVGDGYFTGVVTSGYFVGDGSQLTNIGLRAAVAYASSAGIATYAPNAGIATYSTLAGIATYTPNAGIATYAPNAGIATYSTLAGIATYTPNAGVATALQNARNFSITGNFVTATSISFDGTGNVALAATIPLDAIGLGTYTTGDYVKSIFGTSNQITVSATSGEGSTPTLSIPNQFTVPQDLTVTRDVQINRNLNVTGNITIGGTTAFVNVQQLQVYDQDLVLGFRTDSFGNDSSNDTTANHGGIAIASTEGTPLVSLYNPGIGESTVATYKKIMWFKSGSFVGLNTDAWLFNYGVGIGSTQLPSGTRLAVGNVQFTQSDLAVVRNINASGIITATTFSGTLSGYATSAGISTYATSSGYATTAGIATAAQGLSGTPNLNVGVVTATSYNGSGTNLTGIVTSIVAGTGITIGPTNGIGQVTIYSTASSTASYATSAGIATYATSAGIATYATSSGISTYASTAGIATYATSAGIATYATSSGISSALTSTASVNTSGIITASSFVGSGIALTGIVTSIVAGTGITIGPTNGIGQVTIYSTASGGSVSYAASSGISTSVVGGIASVTQLSVSGLTTFSGVTTFTTGTYFNSAYFADNNNLYFGSSNDLRIYHSGGNAYIKDVGRGDLILASDGNGISLRKYVDADQYMAEFLTSGPVKLYYNNANKFETLSIGATVTGTFFSDQLSVGGTVTATTFSGSHIGSGTNLTGIVTSIVAGTGITIGPTNGIGQVTIYSTASSTASYAPSAGVATYATSAGIATYATSAGIATYATSAGIATYAPNAGFSTSAGISTSVIGGIASVTTLSASGISTFNNNIYIPSSSVGIGTTNPLQRLQVGTANTLGISTDGKVFVVTSSSDVGIGTTNPIAKLDVRGDVNISGVITATTFSGTLSGYATSAGIATYATSAGIATYATSAGIATYATSAGIATYASTAGIATYASTAGIATYAPNAGFSTSAGISTSVIGGIASVTQLSVSGISTLGIVTAGSIYSTGIITASRLASNIAQGTAPISVASSTLVANLNANYLNGQPDTYYTNASNLSSGIVPAARLQNANAFSIFGDLNVTGNISIGGTSAFIAVNELVVKDKDLVVGYTTNALNQDVSNDDTANHGGIAVASTVGSYLVPLQKVGLNTLPETYKQIMWVKNGTFGVGTTDAWISNQAIGIGSTLVPNGVRLAVGQIQMTDTSITATTFNGTLSGYATSAGIATNLTGGSAGVIPYQSNTGITSFTQVGTAGSILVSNGSGIPYWGSISAGGGIAGITIKDEGIQLATNISSLNFVGPNITATTSGTGSTITVADYVSNAGVATYAPNAGISTDVIGGIASVTQLSVSGISTLGTVQISSGIITSTNPGITTVVYYGDGSKLSGVNAQSGIFVADEGSVLGSGVTTLNFSGPNVTALVTTNGIGTVTIDDYVSSAGVATYAGIATNLANGSAGQIPYQSGANATSFTQVGTAGSILISGGTGVPTWGSISAAGGIAGITIKDEGTTLASNISSLNFVGPNITATISGTGSTITVADYVSSAGVATYVKGGLTGNVHYQSSPDITAFLPNGATGTILQSNGVGIAPSWVPAAPASAISGLTVQDEGTIVGSSNSVSQFNFVGPSVVATASGSASTVTIGGVGKFDTNIDNALYIQPTGTLDVIGVGTTTTQITTFPTGSTQYVIHSIHVTNISNGDAEITAGFIMNANKVPASISVSAGSSGGPGIHTFAVGSASSITVGMAVTGTGNIGETTGIGSIAGFQFNTYVTSVDGTSITLSKPMSGRATGVLYFSPVSKVSSRLPVPVGSAVELLKQPFILNGGDSIVLQSTGIGSTGNVSTSTAAISQTANSNFLTVTAGAAITNFLTSGMLIQGTSTNTGIQTNTFVGVGYTPGQLSIPITRPATSTLASQILSFTEVVVPEDGALQATIVYQSQQTDTSYKNGTGTVSAASSTTTSVTAGLSTVPVAYYGTGFTYPSIIQSIRVSNISDSSIYPAGDYPVSVGIGNSDTIFSWLAYNMIVPKNSSIELCEAPKRLGIGQSIFAVANTPYTIEIQIAGRQKLF